MHGLRFRLAHHGSADFLRLHDSPWCADNLRIRNDAFVVDDLGIGDDPLPIDDAWFDVATWLVNDFWFHYSFRAWNNMLIHDGTAAVNHLSLGYYTRGLLDSDKSWATLCRRTDCGALRHTIQIMCRICFWNARITDASRSAWSRTGTLG